MIFIHPGFGKTATTFLQEKVFHNQKNINSLGRPYYSSDRKNNLFFCEEIQKNSCFYEPRVAQKLIKKIYKPKMVNILSDEVLGSSCYANENVILRIQKFFPNAKIFFTIRNQFDSIKSFYANHGRILKLSPKPYKGRFIKFNDWFDYEIKNLNLPNNYLGIIQYEPLIKLFEKYFGRKNISILLYEEFISNQDTFFRKLNRILDVNLGDISKDKVKQRISRSEYNYIKFRNKFLRGFPISRIIPFSSFFKNKFFNLLESSNKYELKFNDQQIKTLKSIYSKTNHKLSRNYKLNLSKWLYPM